MNKKKIALVVIAVDFIFFFWPLLASAAFCWFTGLSLLFALFGLIPEYIWLVYGLGDMFRSKTEAQVIA